MVTGLIVGKFYPFHRGHEYLIDTAAGQCDRLYVIMASLPEEADVPGWLRYEAMRETYYDHPEVVIVHLTEAHPQYPRDDPDFYAIWQELVDRYVPEPIDIIFSSESYGPEFAESLGASRWVCVDRERVQHPVSGSVIRGDLSKHFGQMAPAMQRRLAHRVALVGTESVGKSVMADYLAERLGAVAVHEFGRDYCEAETTTRDVTELTEDDYRQIGEETTRQIREEAARPRGLLTIFDTELLVTCAWAELSLGAVPEWLWQLALETAPLFDLYILLKATVPFVDDGTRMLGEGGLRERHEAILVRLMEEAGSRYVVVDEKDFEVRKAEVVEAVLRVI